MADRIRRAQRATPTRTPLDALMAVDGEDPHAWLASADIILSGHRSRRAATRWVARTFHRFPGCAVAAGCASRGRIAIGTRDGHLLLVTNRPFDHPTVRTLARLVHASWAMAAGRTGLREHLVVAASAAAPGASVRLTRWDRTPDIVGRRRGLGEVGR
jgi:hypothetical protein